MVAHLLSQSEGTAKLLPVAVARPHLHSCVNHLYAKSGQMLQMKQQSQNKRTRVSAGPSRTLSQLIKHRG